MNAEEWVISKQKLQFNHLAFVEDVGNKQINQR